MIGINEYVFVFPESNTNDNICETELNWILFNSIHNTWISQAYVHVFDCETITLKYVNIFEHTEIAEPIYEVVVEPSLKNNRVDDNCAGHSRKIWKESALSTRYSETS